MGEISVSSVKLAPWERALPERLEGGNGGAGAGACPGNLLKEAIRAVCFSCLWMWSLAKSKEWNERKLDADGSEAVATAGC